MKIIPLSIAMFCLALCQTGLRGQAQNLVPDSSFEAVTSQFCGILPNASAFNSLFTHWQAASSGSGDFFSELVDTTCFNHCTNPNPPGPIPPKGVQTPRNGNSYAGIFLYTIPNLEQREYLQTALSAPLVPGEMYELSAWVSLADYSEYATSSLDFLLSTWPAYTGSNQPLPYSPQTSHSVLLSSTTDWMLVRDTLLVDSAYEYLTIGNFKDDASTVLSSNPGSGGGPGQYGSYYFVEDVSVRRVATMTGIHDGSALAAPQARVPGTWFPSRSPALAPILPGGGRMLSFRIYDSRGQQVHHGKGPNAAWRHPSQASGVYFWQLEWEEGTGAVHGQRGKVLVVH